MPWLELKLSVSKTEVDAYEDSLLETGALAVTCTDAGDQPILEPDVGTTPLWNDVRLVALYEVTTDTTTVENILSVQQSIKPAEFLWNNLEDRVWEREWLKYHKPIQFGDAFWVYHEKVESEIPTLLLDPGMAFGTGSHPTTAMCLQWVADQTWQGKSLIDFGCGSGILAVAALLGGADTAYCVDIDAQALEATENNAKRNHLNQQQLKLFFPQETPDIQVAALVANILAGPLCQLAELLSSKVISGGTICLSGILDDQKASIIKAYESWFDDIDVEKSGDWIRMTGIRNEQPTGDNP